MTLEGCVVQRSPASVVPVVLVQSAVQQDLNHGGRALGSRHTQHCPALTVDTVSVAAPEQEDVDDVQVTHAGSSEQGGLAWRYNQSELSQSQSSVTFFVRVINVRLVLQQDLTDGRLAFKCRDEERRHAVPVTLVGVGSVVQEESDQPAVSGLKQKSANYRW